MKTIKELYEYFNERGYPCVYDTKRELRFQNLKFKELRLCIRIEGETIKVMYTPEDGDPYYSVVASYNTKSNIIYTSKYLRIKSTNSFIQKQKTMVADLMLLFQENSIRFIKDCL